MLQLDEQWHWNDPALCNEAQHKQPFSCYFNVHSRCPRTLKDKPIDFNNDFSRCPKYITDLKSRTEFRAAAMEFLFSNLNSEIVDTARAAIVDVFGEKGIPEDLITVHVRWGDKALEMTLVTENEFYQAINEVVTNHTIANPHIYVATSDPQAVTKLQEMISKHGKAWTLHHYDPMKGSADQISRGASGKISLVELLLAMEAKYFVLTTGSNWSRLMNELRTNVVDVACGNCTRMFNLREGFHYNDWRL